MMNFSTNALYQRYNRLLKTFPDFGEPKVTIYDMGDWGCFSVVEENGEQKSYDYDIEHPERYCPNRRDQPPEHAAQHAAYEARCAAISAESRRLQSRLAVEEESAAYTRRDYEPPPPGDPVLYDHLTKYNNGPPLDPPLWETWSKTGPIVEGKSLIDPRQGLGGPGGGSLVVVESKRRK
jgi:hypothetical protein